MKGFKFLIKCREIDKQGIISLCSSNSHQTRWRFVRFSSISALLSSSLSFFVSPGCYTSFTFKSRIDSLIKLSAWSWMNLRVQHVEVPGSGVVAAVTRRTQQDMSGRQQWVYYQVSSHTITQSTALLPPTKAIHPITALIYNS